LFFFLQLQTNKSQWQQVAIGTSCTSYTILIVTSVGQFSPEFSITLRINCFHFGWKLSWKLILRFSPMWKLTRITLIRNISFKKKRMTWVFTWKLVSDSQGLGGKRVAWN
jgi:hypothetical protein